MRFANVAAGAGLMGLGVMIGEGIRSYPDLGEQAAASQQMLEAGQITAQEHEANLMGLARVASERADAAGPFE